MDLTEAVGDLATGKKRNVVEKASPLLSEQSVAIQGCGQWVGETEDF